MDPILSGPALGVAMHIALAQEEQRMNAEALQQDAWRDSAMEQVLTPAEVQQSPVRLYAQYPLDCARYEAASGRREFDWSGNVRLRDVLRPDEAVTPSPAEPPWRAKEPTTCRSGGSAWR